MVTQVVVLGSINQDLIAQVPQLPQTGETVIGDIFFMAGGGKGANQAVAIAKLGIPVAMVGQVGADDFGNNLIQGLTSWGVNTDGITINPETFTGVALISVDPDGNNTVACAAGGNALVGQTEISVVRHRLQGAKLLLLDQGIAIAAIVQGLKEAKALGVTTILDPAPFQADFPQACYGDVDILTPNEVEASQLVGFTVKDPTTAARAAQIIHRWGVKNVVITLGAQGVWWTSDHHHQWLPPYAVNAIDTVAAGDGFNGALAAAIALGKDLPLALRWATIAGGLTVTKAGAQPALPDRDTFLAAVEKTIYDHE